MKKALKKFFKVIGWILLVLLILFVILSVVCTIWSRSQRKKDIEVLEKDGFANLVSAGDYDMNINIFGDGKYKIIAMPGNGDSTFPIDMKKFSEHLSDDISLVVVSRPGYGISSETKQDLTTEYIVESTRTALKNAGIETPYILMPHSLSGVYGTYWESKYPDEVSGVIFLDSLYDGSEVMPEHGLGKILYNAYHNVNKYFCKTGLTRAVDAIKGYDGYDYYGEYKKDAVAFSGATQSGSQQENKNLNKNMRTAWEAIETNDIPKIYITTDYETLEDVKAANDYYEFGMTEEDMQKRYEEDANPSDWKKEKTQKKDSYIEKLGNCKKVNIPGTHFMYELKPEETAKVIEDFISELK